MFFFASLLLPLPCPCSTSKLELSQPEYLKAHSYVGTQQAAYEKVKQKSCSSQTRKVQAVPASYSHMTQNRKVPWNRMTAPQSSLVEKNVTCGV